jgi:putative hydrolase of the HAD superfamily
MTADSKAPSASIVRWAHVDTVLLDMDGTLLVLRFDNYFWQELVPQRFAALQQLSARQAAEQLVPRFAAKQGTLDWYCTDYWSRELGLDIAGLKREVGARVCFLPGAEQFLVQLRARGLRVVLVTNAHQDSLSVKAQQTGLTAYFDLAISSHQLGLPKEHPQFWPKLVTQLNFDPRRAVLVDDNLAVLRAAQAYGISQVVAVSRPDSAQPVRTISEFPSIAAVIDLLD